MKTNLQLEHDVHNNLDTSDAIDFKYRELSIKLGAREMPDFKTSYHAYLSS